MTNPHADPTKANTRRQEIIAEKVKAAGEWLNEIERTICSRRTWINASRSGLRSKVIREYAQEYAAILNIHIRTARKYLMAALEKIK
jgi:hypothetical protein